MTSGSSTIKRPVAAFLGGCAGVVLAVTVSQPVLAGNPLAHPSRSELVAIQKAYGRGLHERNAYADQVLAACEHDLAADDKALRVADDVLFDGSPDQQRAERLSGCLIAVRNAESWGAAAMRAELERCAADLH